MGSVLSKCGKARVAIGDITSSYESMSTLSAPNEAHILKRQLTKLAEQRSGLQHKMSQVTDGEHHIATDCNECIEVGAIHHLCGIINTLEAVKPCRY